MNNLFWKWIPIFLGGIGIFLFICWGMHISNKEKREEQRKLNLFQKERDCKNTNGIWIDVVNSDTGFCVPLCSED